jgi:hypothetical protein
MTSIRRPAIAVTALLVLAGCSTELAGQPSPAPTPTSTESTWTVPPVPTYVVEDIPDAAATVAPEPATVVPAVPEPSPSPAAAAPPAPAIEAPPPEPDATVSQDNALRKAESYLDFQAFSRSGLIKQLEFEGFSTADATFAVDNVTVDWMEQAAKKAGSYMDLQAFSRSGLVDQLEFEGFTSEQAQHGADAVGL